MNRFQRITLCMPLVWLVGICITQPSARSCDEESLKWIVGGQAAPCFTLGAVQNCPMNTSTQLPCPDQPCTRSMMNFYVCAMGSTEKGTAGGVAYNPLVDLNSLPGGGAGKDSGTTQPKLCFQDFECWVGQNCKATMPGSLDYRCQSTGTATNMMRAMSGKLAGADCNVVPRGGGGPSF